MKKDHVLALNADFKCKRLKQIFVKGLAKGKYKGKFPGERFFAKKYKVNFKTVNKAVSELVAEGRLYRRVGEGTFIAGPKSKKQDEARRLLGVIIEDVKNPFFAELIRGVEDAAHAHQYSIILCNSDGKAEKEKDYLQRLMAEKVSGLITAPVSGCNVIDIQKVIAANIPVVMVDRYLADLETADYVVTDNKQGAHDLTSYLIAQGHTRIAFVSEPRDLSIGHGHRYQGYEKALRDHGLKVNQDWIQRAPSDSESDIRAAVHKVLDLANRPTAIFALHDRIAKICAKVIKEKNLKIPQDITLSGFDLEIVPELEIPFITVVQQRYAMGHKAAEVLMEKIQGKIEQGCRQKILLNPKLEVKE